MSEWRKFNVLAQTGSEIELLEENLERAKESIKTYKYDSTKRAFILSSEPFPYIIMSYDTFQELLRIAEEFEVWEDCNYMYVMSYKGYKIFINNDLEFGEVELR